MANLRVTQDSIEIAGIYIPVARVTKSILEVSATNTRQANISEETLEVITQNTRSARVTKTLLEVSAKNYLESHVSELVLEVIVPTSQPEVPTGDISPIPTGWNGWPNILNRVTHGDIKLVHRFLGIGESEKFNRVTKSNSIDLQTGILQARYLDHLIIDSITENFINTKENIKTIQHYRQQISWRIK